SGRACGTRIERPGKRRSGVDGLRVVYGTDELSVRCGKDGVRLTLKRDLRRRNDGYGLGTPGVERRVHRLRFVVTGPYRGGSDGRWRVFGDGPFGIQVERFGGRLVLQRE